MRSKVDGVTLLVKKSEQDMCPAVPPSLLPGIFDNCLLFFFNQSSWENCSRASASSTAQVMQNLEKYSGKLLFNSQCAEGPVLLPDLASIAQLLTCAGSMPGGTRSNALEGKVSCPSRVLVLSRPSRSVCACEALGGSSPALPGRKEV